MIISRPLERFRILPIITPNATEMGMETMAARIMPGMPQTCQSAAKISPISPAMAPSVIPKFIPMPAITGISRLRIKNALRPRRVMTSFKR